eukprot:8752513-Pyramimonas_sp.AAC.1
MCIRDRGQRRAWNGELREDIVESLDVNEAAPAAVASSRHLSATLRQPRRGLGPRWARRRPRRARAGGALLEVLAPPRLQRRRRRRQQAPRELHLRASGVRLVAVSRPAEDVRVDVLELAHEAVVRARGHGQLHLRARGAVCLHGASDAE